MWTELVELFRPGHSMEGLREDFREMYGILVQMGDMVEPHIFEHSLSLEERRKIYKMDIEVNKLERKIRKRIITHLGTSQRHVPFCLLLMSLVKDVERVGDYLKNISEVSELGGGSIPEGPLHDELKDLVEIAMQLLAEVHDVFERQDVERAHELVQLGQVAGKRCDKLLVELAKSDFNATQTTSMVLLTRFYKRVGGHLLNVLSGVLMPLHKVDFYDERVMGG